MKKTAILFLILFPIFHLTHAQDVSPIVKFLFRNGYTFPDTSIRSIIPDSMKKWPDTVFYYTNYKPHLMRSATIPYALSKFEYADGKYQVEPVLSVGYGYTWFKGTFVFDEDDNVIISPGLYWGALVNAGIQSNFNVSKLSINPNSIYNSLGSFFAGGFIGFSSLSIYLGYDFISHGPTVGLGGRVDLYTINNKYLKFLGKVRSVRKHKKIVPPISIND